MSYRRDAFAELIEAAENVAGEKDSGGGHCRGTGERSDLMKWVQKCTGKIDGY